MFSKTVNLSADYLVVGAGAMGMAFADEVINQGNDKTTTIVMVDCRAKPGGHWNDAYDFVTLHQPAAYYGVNSRMLGGGGKDLVSKFQILAYYELCLKQMVETGRLVFYPQCKYLGEGRFVSLLDEELEYEVDIKRKEVDASYLTTHVPSTSPPKYQVGTGVNLIPINGLAKLTRAWEKFVIIGGGKTGIDAILHLLWKSVSPEKIVWIIPNDSWYQNRDMLMVDSLGELFLQSIDTFVEASSSEDHYRIFEKKNAYMRLDSSVWPTKQKCATVSSAELEDLKRVKNILRQGRVASLERDKILFEDGSSTPTSTSWLHVDCTADGLASRPPVPIFQGNKLVLQSVSVCQQVVSAAMIAALELYKGEDDERKNQILQAVPHPDYPRDIFSSHLIAVGNEERFIQEGPGFFWLRNSRLTYYYHFGKWMMTKIMIAGYRSKDIMITKLKEWSKEGPLDCKQETNK